MFKFFRKYQKVIILVGLPILLVLFLIPQAIQGIGDYIARSGRSSATFVDMTGASYTVSAGEYRDAQSELAVLTRGFPGGVNLSLVFFEYDRTTDPLTGQSESKYIEVANAGHWLLLVHEAKTLGLIGGAADAERLATNLGFALASVSGSEEPIDPRTVMGNLRGNAGVSYATVVNTLANVRGVQRMIALYAEAGSGRVSRERLQMIAENVLQGIDARTVVISADDETEDLAQPTDEQLQQQLEAHREFNPGEGERGFGYRLPHRVKLEWLEIDAASARESLRHADQASRLEIRKYWLQNKTRFIPPGTTDVNSIEFADVEDQVRDALLDEISAKAIDNMVRFAEGEIIRTTRELERDGPYFNAPDDWADRRMSLPTLALEVQNQFEAGLPGYTNRRDQWLSAEDINLLPGVGVARTSHFGTPMRLSDILPKLKEFGGDSDDRVYAQAGFVLPTFQAGGRRFLVRIVDTQESHPADSIDDVREQLAEDVKRIAHYDQLALQMSEIEQVAIAEGMESLADDYDTFAQSQRNIGYAPAGSLLTQFQLNATQFMPPVGRDEPTINTVVEYARWLIDRMLDDGIAFDDFSLDERTFVVEASDKLSLVVIQLTDLRPLTEDNLLIYSRVVSELISEDEVEDDAMELFTEQRMIERYQYEPVGGFEDDRDDEEDLATEDSETPADDATE